MRWFSLIAASIIIASCSTTGVDVKSLSCSEHSDLIKAKETAFVESNYSDELMQEMLVSYANFANNCNTDSLAPEFLMRRADLLRGKGAIRESISQFKAIHDGYPQYHNKITCAFIAAFLYETELNDRDMAEKLYLQIIEDYPESHEAEVARISLRHLRETTDELIRRLQNNE
jgi:tetratricopeptide (TPR) repeat protein